MGTGASSVSKYDQIIKYYLFQKEIESVMNNLGTHSDSKDIRKGFLVSPEWLDDWKTQTN